MRKLFYTLVLMFSVLICTTSCITTADAQSDVVCVSDGIDFSVIITNGVPVYTSAGFLLYYRYGGYYYYPYYNSDRWYFRSYSRPVSHYRPLPRDFYNRRPNISSGMAHNRQSFGGYHRPNIGYRNGGQMSRPRHQSGRIGGVNHHRYGGRR